MFCDSFKKKIVGAVFKIFEKSLTKNYNGNDPMKKSNSRDCGNQNKTFTATTGRLNMFSLFLYI